MIRNSNSGNKDNVINQNNTFIPVLLGKKDDNYHLLAQLAHNSSQIGEIHNFASHS